MAFLSGITFEEVKHNIRERIFMHSYPTRSPMVLIDGHGQGDSHQVLCTIPVGSFQFRIQFPVFRKCFSLSCSCLNFIFSGDINQIVEVTFWMKCWYLWLQHLNPEQPFLLPSRCHIDLCFGFG